MKSQTLLLIDGLRKFYRYYDLGQEGKLTDDEIDKYHERVIECGRLDYVLGPGGALLGYIEAWRLTKEQIGRKLFSEEFNIFKEDITSGPVCFVANITIHPDERRGSLLNLLKGRCIQKNFTATHFCGEANHGKAKSFKIFTKKEFWIKKEVGCHVIK